MYLITKVLDNVETTFKQKLTTPFYGSQLYAVRPHLLRYGNPAGSVRMRLLDQNSNFIELSPSFSISTIGTGNYWHGYVRFYLATALMSQTNYFFQLETTGYTYADTDYLGWVNDYDLRILPLGYTPSNDGQAPLDIELWDYVEYNRKTG